MIFFVIDLATDLAIEIYL